MKRTKCTICIAGNREAGSRKVTNEYIGLHRSDFAAQLFFIFSGLERRIYTKRKCATSMPKHARCRSHNEGLAALRHIAKRIKIKAQSTGCLQSLSKKEEARNTFAVLIVSIVQHNNNILHEDCCSKSEAYFLFCFSKRNHRYCMLYVFACVTLHNFWRFLYLSIRMNAILFFNFECVIIVVRA